MILLVLASWIGLTLAEKRTESHGIGKDDLNNIIFYGLLAFVFGGRISFIAQNLPAFSKHPLDIISIDPNLFDLFGGLAVAIIVAFIFGQRKSLKFWNVLDALTPFFATLAIGLGFAHLASGDFYGKETSLPIAIEIKSALRHPTQIYEIIASLLTFSLVWFQKQNPRPGILFLTFAALTAFFQIIIQTFRADVPLIFNSINQTQVIAWVVMAICFFLMEFQLKDPKGLKDL
jgi:phosphatidylglycerol:prolipoprotein diacylglycerol transferase